MAKDEANKFGGLIIGLHWLMLLLLVLVYASMELRGIFSEGQRASRSDEDVHYMLGLSVFALVWIHLGARLWYATPPIQPMPP